MVARNGLGGFSDGDDGYVTAIVAARVSDPHWFNADPDTDPDPAFFLIAYPDQDEDSWSVKLTYHLPYNIVIEKKSILVTILPNGGVIPSP